MGYFIVIYNSYDSSNNRSILETREAGTIEQLDFIVKQLLTPDNEGYVNNDIMLTAKITEQYDYEEDDKGNLKRTKI